MLAELRQEREQIEEAIMSLERLARGRGKRRGRPPAWMTEVKRRRPATRQQKQTENRGQGFGKQSGCRIGICKIELAAVSGRVSSPR